MAVRNADFLQYINEKGSVTAEELHEKFGGRMQHIRTWLSRNKTNGTLIYIAAEPAVGYDRPKHRIAGRYAISPDKIDRLAYFLM